LETVNGFRTVESSFRDPSGYIFENEGKIYRCVKQSYREHYEHLICSGLCDKLIENNLLLPFSPVTGLKTDDSYCILKPKYIEHISYPYEWCFSQFKDAALLTLKIALISLDYEMILKDASAYNVQFIGCTPQFIDTLSFEKIKLNSPWIAYRQFCQHFLAPLLLMAERDISLNSLLKIYLDGIPLEIASKLLGFQNYTPKAFIHILFQSKFSSKPHIEKIDGHRFNFTKKDYQKILGSLIDIIENLNVKLKNKNWGDYYESKILNSEYLKDKEQKVSEFLDIANPETVYDLGSNTGRFSRIASKYASSVISVDNDPECVEINYRKCKESGETRILPLILDLSNPSPSNGWDNSERDSFYKRIKKDTTLALALVHHLAISNNLPLSKIAFFFNEYSKKLIIEFVPKDDPKVQILLQNRTIYHKKYTREFFEESFKRYFEIIDSVKLKNSDRVLYYMRNKNE
jgi:ribosomal protein L11 methylase PrmA